MEYVDKTRLLPPPELQLGWTMQSFSGMLEDGGAMNQPLGLTTRVIHAINTFKLWSTYRTLKGGSIAKWIKAYPDDWKRVKQIEEMITNG